MVVQIIEGRYTVDHAILKSYLEDLFGDQKFEISVSMWVGIHEAKADSTEQLPDEGEKWKVQVPRELTRVGSSHLALALAWQLDDY